MKKQAARMRMSNDPMSQTPSSGTPQPHDPTPRQPDVGAAGDGRVAPSAEAGPDILPFQAAGPVPAQDNELAALIATGRAQGYLTFDQVNSYLPDEAVDPEKIDALLVALEEKGIDLLDEPPAPIVAAVKGPAAKATAAPRRDEAITSAPWAWHAAAMACHPAAQRSANGARSYGQSLLCTLAPSVTTMPAPPPARRA
jgi:ribosomal protein L12E/L44/L45/RPP1/RPP2